MGELIVFGVVAIVVAKRGRGGSNDVLRASQKYGGMHNGVAAPEMRPAAFTVPITSAAAAPEVAGAGNLFSSMGMAGAAGGAVGSTTSLGRGNERVRMTPRQSPKPTTPPPNEAVTAIATELQELATRAQSLLAKLAESGLLTTEEVTEQKRRFLG